MGYRWCNGPTLSVFGLIKDKHLFYDRKLGSNVSKARHALSLDELRDDFEPTIWDPKPGVDLKQVWFAGVHSDVGGSYKPDDDGTVLADIPMKWLQDEAKADGLYFDDYLSQVTQNPHASQHNEYKGKYRFLGKRQRKIPAQDVIPTCVHRSVYERYNQDYTSKSIEAYISNYGEWPPLTD